MVIIFAAFLEGPTDPAASVHYATMIWKAKLYILDFQHTTSFGQDTFWTYNILQVLEKMEIEDFTEDDFYQEEILRNLIEL